MRTVLLLLALTLAAFAPCAFAQRAVVTMDSLPVASVRTHILASGSLVIGGGDSVTVAVDGIGSDDLVIATYSAPKTAEAAVTSVLTTYVWAPGGTLTVYGTAGKTVNYILIR